MQELATIPEKNTLAVFTENAITDGLLDGIRAKIDAFEPDISNDAGRKDIASFAYKIAQTKTYIDGKGKTLVTEYKEIPKKIDASRKKIRDTLDEWKDEVRQPLTDFENVEKERIAHHNQNLELINALATDINPVEGNRCSSQELSSKLDAVNKIGINDSWEEFKQAAAEAKETVTNYLETRISEQTAIEAQAVENERLKAEAEERERKDRDERLKREAAEQARAEAEAKAKSEREAVEREKAEAEAQAKAEKEAAERRIIEAEQRTKDAEKQAKIDAEQAAQDERDKIAREEAQKITDQKRREADKAHRATINNAAVKALMGLKLPEAKAKAIIELIVRGNVPNVTINY